MNQNIIRHQFGQHYTVQHLRQLKPGLRLEPVHFNNLHQTMNFLRQLKVPHDYWEYLLRDYHGAAIAQKTVDIHQQASELFIRGKLLLFPIRPLDPVKNPPHKVTIKQGGTFYRFTEASALLLGNPPEVKRFASQDEAKAFINELAPDSEKLQNIAHELSIPLSNASEAELGSRIAEQLVSGKAVIIVDKTSSAPTSEQAEEVKNDIGNRKAGLAGGAAATAAEEAAAEEEKPCTTEWISVECGHNGRMAGITDKTETTPILAIVATEKDESGFDKITAEIHASELCDSHKSSNFRINQEHKLLKKEEKKIAFNACCEEWSMDNVFDRLWLPTVSPRTYTITPKTTCKTKDLKVSSINVDVYPKMKWDWDVNMNFGTLKFVPGKAKVEYSNVDIDGNVKLTYDNEEHDAKEKYDEYITKPLEGFKSICEKIGKVLEVINNPKEALMRIGTQAFNPPPPEGEDNTDGNETHLIVDWPNLSLKYESELIEAQSPSDIEHKFSVSLAASPLINVNIQVDVLESLIKLAPLGVKELIKYAKERVEKEIEEDAKVGFRGELDIIFTVDTKIDIKDGKKIESQHNINDDKLKISPITGDIVIPAELKGAIKAEGKWFFITIKVNYQLQGKAGWEGTYEIGKDDKGVYFSSNIEFTGIDIIATKYEEVKTKVSANKDKVDDTLSDLDIDISNEDSELSIEMKDSELKGEATLKAEETQQWSWLKPDKNTQKENPERYYLIRS